MLNLRLFSTRHPELIYSKLFNETTFYQQFLHDLNNCRSEVIIESPFISSQRMCCLTPTIQKLVNRKIKVYVITRHPDDHSLNMKKQAETEIRNFEMIGVQIIINTNYNHRKLAIIDRKILWEGSLNILSQTHSQEFMRRIKSTKLAKDCFKFIKLEKYVY